MNTNGLKFVALAAVASLAASAARGEAPGGTLGAREPGTILLRVGTHDIIPQKPNAKVGGADLDVESAWGFTFNGTYFFTKNIAVELLAAAPFEHDVLLGGSTVATTHHMPPTLSVQWHFAPNSPFQPYLGAGVNYTFFLGTSSKGALAGTSIDLGGSVGPAVQGGLDYRITKNLFINAEARWISIKSNLTVRDRTDGSTIAATKVDISPVAVGLNVGWQF